MNNTAQIKSSKIERPILIVDKKGVIGLEIARRLSQNFIVVLVSPREFSEVNDMVHVPFVKKIPTIPDNYYSHMILVDDGDVLAHSLPSFISKADKDGASLVLVQGIRQFNEKCFDQVHAHAKSKVVFYGDLISDKYVLSDVGREIIGIKDKRVMEIEGDGFEELWPISLHDFIDYFIEQIFVRNSTSNILNIFPKAPHTKLSLARIMQSIDPLIKIDFIKKKKTVLPVVIKSGEPIVDKYDLKEEIKKILESEVPGDFVQEKLSEEIGERRYLRGTLLFFIVFLLFFMFLPLITTYGYAALGVYELNNVKINFEKGDISKSLISAKKAQSFFSFASKTLAPLKSEMRLIRQGAITDRIEQRIQIGEQVSSATVSLVESTQMARSVLFGKSSNPSQDLSRSISLMKSSISDFQSIEAQGEQIPEIKDKIKTITPIINLLSSTIDLMPEVLGFKREMKYLVLFQNNMELRPGGGFIGSYGILDIKNGIVKDFKIDDVYNPDGQLKGHIEPPFPIRRFLPQPHWFLRDSNFDIDWERNASEAAFLFNLETDQSVDGVIGIDVNVLKNILEVTGPINVLDYNVTIDSNNFYSKVQENAQQNFFPGSTRKKDFLTSVFKSLQDKLLETKDIPYVALFRIIDKSLRSKDILLASPIANIQQAVEVNGWSSVPQNSIGIRGNNFNDFIGISEANLGINKVNYQISRSVSKATMIDDDGSVSSTVTIAYKNDSSKLGYKNYLRIILPANINVSQLSFDNVSQQIVPAVTNASVYEARGFKPPVGIELNQVDDGDKTTVGFLLNVNPSSLKTISLTYEQKESLVLGDTISYSLSYFKQPGTGEYPFDLSIYGPKNYSLVKKEKGTEINSEKVEYSTSISEDKVLNFVYSNK